jgi:tRNA A37 threonylcarbamoyladenosine synthetase subunit TsaC/SUA5/YrdC
MYSFQVYANRALVQFIPEKTKSIFDLFWPISVTFIYENYSYKFKRNIHP